MSKRILALSVAAAALFLNAVPGSATGTGSFNAEIHWYGDLTYTVDGGPPNTCGDLWTSRNGGAYVEGQGWLCTDSNGDATKGPWSWDDQVGDETAFAYIEWPGGGTTNTAKHIWDKTCGSTTITSGTGSPPTSFSGTATDTAWGAGFNASWTECKAYFLDVTTGEFWTPFSGVYDQTTFIDSPCTVSGMPAFAVTWSASQIPPSNTHTTGHCYEWWAYVTDGWCTWATNTRYFCK